MRLKMMKEVNKSIGEWKHLIGKNPIVLYGAGKYGVHALHNIRKYIPDVKILCFVDDNLVRNNKQIDGLDVITLQDAIYRYKDDFIILITNFYVSQVLKQLEKAQFNIEKVLFRSDILIEDIDVALKEEHKNDFEMVFHWLEDYKSKMIYKTMIESRSTKNMDALACLCEDV